MQKMSATVKWVSDGHTYGAKWVVYAYVHQLDQYLPITAFKDEERPKLGDRLTLDIVPRIKYHVYGLFNHKGGV